MLMSATEQIVSKLYHSGAFDASESDLAGEPDWDDPDLAAWQGDGDIEADIEADLRREFWM